MFGRKKSLKNEVFGEMKYWGIQWESNTKITIELWNKTYHINLSVVAKSEKDGISEKQENVFKYFKETIHERQKEIERSVGEYFDTCDEQILISKFTPTELEISIKGECALLADNADDDDSHDPPLGLAVVVLPKAAVFTQEEYAGYIFGGGDYFITKELYGDED